MNIYKVTDGKYAVEQQLVQFTSKNIYECNCEDYIQYKTCRHMRFLVSAIFAGIEAKHTNGEISDDDYVPKKEKFDRIMAIKEPAPAFLQEIPLFQKSIRKILSVPRGNLKNIEKEGLDADTIIQQLF